MMNNMKSALGEAASQPDTVLFKIRAEIYEAQGIASDARNFIYAEHTRLLGTFPVDPMDGIRKVEEGEMNALLGMAQDLRAALAALHGEIKFLSSI